jgi:hypothetical protein
MRVFHAFAIGVSLCLGVGSAAAFDLTGAWRVDFTLPSGGLGDTCRFTFDQNAAGQVQGKLTGCILGTNGVFAGAVDAGGGFTLWISAPDDPGCETYSMTGTVTADDQHAEGTFLCEFPFHLAGDFTAAPCDPDLPGSCPGATPTHEVRACRLSEISTGCDVSATAAGKLTLRREDTYHYKVKLRLPRVAGTVLADFGDPTTLRDYVACLYDTSGGVPRLLAMEPIFAGSGCGDGPCWTPNA